MSGAVLLGGRHAAGASLALWAIAALTAACSSDPAAPGAPEENELPEPCDAAGVAGDPCVAGVNCRTVEPDGYPEEAPWPADDVGFVRAMYDVREESDLTHFQWSMPLDQDRGNTHQFAMLAGLDHNYPNGDNNPLGWGAADRFWAFFRDLRLSG